MTDDEIALIRGMLARGMPNDVIHYYFNRLDRLVSPGRVTQIRQLKYAPEVPAASDDAVEAFFVEWKRIDQLPSLSTGHRKDPTHPDLIKSLFECRGTQGWFVRSHETDTLECKEAVRLKPEDRFAKVVKAIAGLANNIGGYVLFGIKELEDKSLKVTGLADSSFLATDPAEISQILIGALSPAPSFRIASIVLDGATVGIIYVEKHPLPPVMAVKNVGSDVKEGSIYFRYTGETRAIKPAELWEIITFRERRAQERLSENVARIANGNALALDLDTGKAEGAGGQIVIGSDLLDKIQFIREGQFRESEGAPVLRVVGDVVPIGRNFVPQTRIVHTNLTSGDVLRSFLKKEPVPNPIPFLVHNAHSTRKWLPIWFYINQSETTADEVIALLAEQKATREQNRDFTIERLKRVQTAYRRPAGRPKLLLSEMNHTPARSLVTTHSEGVLIYAVQGLNARPPNVDELLDLLLEFYDSVNGNNSKESSIRGAIFRAACRLDELIYCE